MTDPVDPDQPPIPYDPDAAPLSGASADPVPDEPAEDPS